MPSHLLTYNYGIKDPTPIHIPPVKERLVESTTFPGYFDLPTTFGFGVEQLNFQQANAFSEPPASSTGTPPPPPSDIPPTIPPPEITKIIFPSRKNLQSTLQSWAISLNFSLVIKTSGKGRMKLGCICGGEYRTGRKKLLKAEPYLAEGSVQAGGEITRIEITREDGMDQEKGEGNDDGDGDEDEYLIDDDDGGSRDRLTTSELPHGPQLSNYTSNLLLNQTSTTFNPNSKLEPTAKPRPPPKTKRTNCPFTLTFQQLKPPPPPPPTSTSTSTSPTPFFSLSNPTSVPGHQPNQSDTWRLSPSPIHNYTHNHPPLPATRIPGIKKLDTNMEVYLMGLLGEGLAPRVVVGKMKERWGVELSGRDVGGLKKRLGKRRRLDEGEGEGGDSMVKTIKRLGSASGIDDQPPSLQPPRSTTIHDQIPDSNN